MKSKKKLLISFVAAITLCVMLLVIERQLFGEEETVQVLVAYEDLAQGMRLDGREEEPIWTNIELPKTLCTSQMITNIKKVPQGILKLSLKKGDILTVDMIENQTEVEMKLNNPVEFGLRAAEVANAAGGVIRSKDCVNLYVWKEETREMKILAEKVYVKYAMDSAGVEVETVGQGVAVLFTLLTEKERAEEIYEEMEVGNLLYITRCVDSI